MERRRKREKSIFNFVSLPSVRFPAPVDDTPATGEETPATPVEDTPAPAGEEVEIPTEDNPIIDARSILFESERESGLLSRAQKAKIYAQSVTCIKKKLVFPPEKHVAKTVKKTRTFHSHCHLNQTLYNLHNHHSTNYYHEVSYSIQYRGRSGNNLNHLFRHHGDSCCSTNSLNLVHRTITSIHFHLFSPFPSSKI